MRNAGDANDDARWMRRALELAAKGRGRVEPNPPVGAVIVRDEKLIGEGYHERFGGAHAEIRAMANCRSSANGQGTRTESACATLYVTLEPCTGLNKKTPPCCDAVIKAGFRRVVIGASDPTQESAVSRLKAAGIAVTTGILEEECRRMIAPFLKLRLRRMPYVIAKWAMTADGRIATVTGESRWISSEASRQLVHQWRNQVNAVLVGIGTVLRDDPLLTSRIPDGRNPLRIVLDAGARTPLTSRLVASAKETPLLVACMKSAPAKRRKRLLEAGCRLLPLPAYDVKEALPQRGARNAKEEFLNKKAVNLPPLRGQQSLRVNAESLLRALGAENLTNLMVEGGGTVLADFFEHRLVDEVRIFVAPKLFGGAAAPGPIGGKGIPTPAHALKLGSVAWTPIGGDMLLTAAVQYPQRRGIGRRKLKTKKFLKETP